MVGAWQSGFEQRCPARPASLLFVGAVKSSRATALLYPDSQDHGNALRPPAGTTADRQWQLTLIFRSKEVGQVSAITGRTRWLRGPSRDYDVLDTVASLPPARLVNTR